MKRRYLIAGALVVIATLGLQMRHHTAIAPSDEGPESLDGQTKIDSAIGRVVTATHDDTDNRAPAASPLVEQLPCESLYPLSDHISSHEAWVETSVNAASILAQSTTAEHLLVAALLRLQESPMPDLTESVTLLERALHFGGATPLLVWHAVHLCSVDNAPQNCRLPEWELLLVSVDGGNSESWARIAANQYQRGEIEQALFSLRRAASADTSSAFYPETAAAVTRGLRASSGLHTYERSIMGLASPSPVITHSATTLCREMALDGEWAASCLAYGRLLEKQGKTILGVQIGLAVQEIVLTAVGDASAAAKVSQRQETYHDRMSILARLNPAQQFAMADNPSLWAELLGHIRSVGELEAWAVMAERMEQHFKLHPELDCRMPEIEAEVTEHAH